MAASFKELRVWQNAVDLAMRLFELSQSFPAHERFSLTDQIRRSSRSVAANITVAWRKRRYGAAFSSNPNDAETEAAETQTWIVFACRCVYLVATVADELDVRCEEVIGQLSAMIREANRWCRPFDPDKQVAGSTPPSTPP